MHLYQSGPRFLLRKQVRADVSGHVSLVVSPGDGIVLGLMPRPSDDLMFCDPWVTMVRV